MIFEGGSKAQIKTCKGGLLVANKCGVLANNDVLRFELTSYDLYSLAESLRKRESDSPKPQETK